MTPEMELSAIYKNIIRSFKRIIKCACMTSNIRLILAFVVSISLYFSLISKRTLSPNYYTNQFGNVKSSCPPDFVVNDYGSNDNMCVNSSRHRDTPIQKLKTILMWNLAYGTKE